MSKSLRAALAAKAEENTQRHRDSNYTDEFDVGRQHKMIRIDLIDRSRFQPRKTFADDGIRSLAISITSEGLLQPITVRSIGERFELIAGERRLLAHRYLSKSNIEALVITADDATAATLALVENLKREDLSDYETAEAIRVLQEAFPKRTKLAESLDIPRSELYRYLSFGKLPAYVRERLEVNPRLLSRKYSEDIVKALKDTNAPELIDAKLRAALDLVEAGKLEQSKIVAFLVKADSPKSTHSARQRATHILRAGSKVGTFSRTADELVLKLSTAALSDDQVETLQRFVIDLVGH